MATAGAAIITLAPAKESPQQSVAAEARAATTTILFFGDMMFDRSVRVAASEKGYDFILEHLAPLIAASDLTVVNLEGPVTSNPSRSVGSVVGSHDNYVFTFEPAVLEALGRSGTVIAGIGNNHIGNFGNEGVVETERNLRSAGMRYFGSPLSAHEPLTVAAAAGDISFLSYNEFSGDAKEASSTITAIADAHARGDIVIVFSHWGVEYAPKAPARVRGLAHAFVEAGADLVIGSHPHVIEDHEVYLGVPVYYSLGNAVFDQYFSPEVRCGLALRVTFSNGSVGGIEEIPLYLELSRQTVAGDPAKAACAKTDVW